MMVCINCYIYIYNYTLQLTYTQKHITQYMLYSLYNIIRVNTCTSMQKQNINVRLVCLKPLLKLSQVQIATHLRTSNTSVWQTILQLIDHRKTNSCLQYIRPNFKTNTSMHKHRVLSVCCNGTSPIERAPRPCDRMHSVGQDASQCVQCTCIHSAKIQKYA